MSDVSLRQRGFDLGLKGMNLAHRVVLGVSGGRLLSMAFGMQTIELHTTGRRSGQRRSVMLTAPIYDGDRVVLVASKGGDDRDPDWYRNLVADPAVAITIKGVESAWTARTATAAEKAELWPRIVAAYRGYAGYQKRTRRDIPVVICTPRSA
ncbi:MAG: nitroreductase/quinone reductase family protein [Nocardioides sp.]|uniref:nitroreductase/quinone reductase family protein n=1 Tax=Nocardioides sp. TaxID=35761 RepID=UPI0039E72757